MTTTSHGIPGAAAHPLQDIRFACDAMCGGLARWLRAIGYDATWSPDIDDGDLVRQADEQGRVLLSSDGGVFERRLLTSGQVQGLLVPHGLRRLDQLAYVVQHLRLRVRAPRCMACGGPLQTVTRQDVAGEVPARSLLWAPRFYRCAGCAKVFWEGSHWRRIEKVRASTAALLEKEQAHSEMP